MNDRLEECFLCGHERPCRCDGIARNNQTVEDFFTGRNVCVPLRNPESLERFEQRIQQPRVERR